MPPSPTSHAGQRRGTMGRVWRDLTSGRATIMAGGVAFYGFLALFPGLFALLALYGLVADRHDVEEQMSGFGRLLPQQVRDAMQTELLAQVNSSAGTLGIELVGSILVAAWSAANGNQALMIAIAEIHGQRESRSRVRVILTALLLTLVAIVSGAIALAAVVALPVMRAGLGLSSTAGPLLSWLRWPALAGILLWIGRPVPVWPPARSREMALGYRRLGDCRVPLALWVSPLLLVCRELHELHQTGRIDCGHHDPAGLVSDDGVHRRPRSNNRCRAGAVVRL